MPLAAGTRLGPYETIAPLGAGGMGEVYRAKDTRLQREVAIKGLPETFAAHPEPFAHRRADAGWGIDAQPDAAIIVRDEPASLRAGGVEKGQACRS